MDVRRYLIENRFTYTRIGHDCRPMRFSHSGYVTEGSAAMEMVWTIDGQVLRIFDGSMRLTCVLQFDQSGNRFLGQWANFERMDIELSLDESGDDGRRTEERIVPFKVFGLQRTGTNLMVELVTRNFLTKSLEIGAEWKHGSVKCTDRGWNDIPSKFILCVKNPYAWLTSCYRYFCRAHTNDRTVAWQFRRNPSMPFEEFVLSPTYSFATAVDRWNRMYRHWISNLPVERTAVVRHEDQVNDQRDVLLAVEHQLGMTRVHNELVTVSRHIDESRYPVREMNLEYYVGREYMKMFSSCLLERVEGLLDAEMMGRFNYRKEFRSD